MVDRAIALNSWHENGQISRTTCVVPLTLLRCWLAEQQQRGQPGGGRGACSHVPACMHQKGMHLAKAMPQHISSLFTFPTWQEQCGTLCTSDCAATPITAFEYPANRLSYTIGVRASINDAIRLEGRSNLATVCRVDRLAQLRSRETRRRGTGAGSGAVWRVPRTRCRSSLPL